LVSDAIARRLEVGPILFSKYNLASERTEGPYLKWMMFSYRIAEEVLERLTYELKEIPSFHFL